MLTSKPHRTEVGKASRKSWDSDSPLGVARSWVVLLTLMRVFKMGKIRETEKGKCRVNLGEHLTTDHQKSPLMMTKTEACLSDPEILNIPKLHIFSAPHSRNNKHQGSPFSSTMHLILKLEKNHYKYPQRIGLTESSIRLLENLHCTQVSLSYCTHK